MKKKIVRLPKEFFEKSRSVISMNEALKDVIPVEWEEEEKKSLKQLLTKKFWKNISKSK